jgi:hypothetical protein
MNVPTEHIDRGHLELMTALPADWPLDFASAGEEAWWPFRLLKRIGWFVHERRTFLLPGQTIQLEDPSQPFVPSTLLSAVLLVPPVNEDDGFNKLEIAGTQYRFLHVVPITGAELEYKLQHGTPALLELLFSKDVGPIIDPRRACAVTGRMLGA